MGLRPFKENLRGMVDLAIVLTIGIVFAGMMVLGYIIWTLKDMLVPDNPGATTTSNYNSTFYSIRNVTGGFDDFINLILIVITVFILALAIAALYMIYQRK